MKTTTALLSHVQKLLARLHPPSPPTAEEGQQLLKVLQSSFRKQLDAEHPHPFKPSSKDTSGHDIPAGRGSAPLWATSHHFGSVLAHPILASTDGTVTKHNAARSLDRLIAESQADVARLIVLLQQHKRELRVSGGLGNDTAFGNKLDDWMNSTDRQSRESFLLNDLALRSALDIFVKEKNEIILWSWLCLVYERKLIHAQLTSKKWLHVEDYLVSRLMGLAIQRHDLDDAAQQFLHACRYRESSGRANPSLHTSRPGLQHTLMTNSAQRLASAIIFHRNQHGISAEAFDDLMKYLPEWTPNPTTSDAFCMVYHPSKPSADLLYDFLQRQSAATVLSERQKSARPTSRRATMTAILDASKLSLGQKKKSQASFLLDFAIDNYPDYLPPRQTDAVEPQLETSFNFVPG
ncbi:hypothetical protein H2198_005661 [Neophaeococcomyces mojaviensis]|uniref:Uncharacterized protein n=1 Tax=Neophaeococcomyces mojaviensis TaxID=3383035 RepID=A0ACC3A512_9EURO|nr:hypothetical protein H2198_005661 [Knufia sp. JES_112]